MKRKKERAVKIFFSKKRKKRFRGLDAAHRLHADGSGRRAQKFAGHKDFKTTLNYMDTNLMP
jgi:hypothetical protein